MTDSCALKADDPRLLRWLMEGGDLASEALAWERLDADVRAALAPLRPWRRQELEAREKAVDRARREHYEEELSREVLANQLAFQHELVETFPNPVFVKNADACFVSLNRAYEEVFGADRNRIIGHTVMDLEYLPLEDRLLYHEEDQRVIRDRLTVHYEKDFLFSDGQWHHCLYWVSGFGRSGGNIGGLVGVIVDISEQKRVERELLAARQVAEVAAEAKSRFLANMSHEIRTPMNAVLGLLHLLERTELTGLQRDYTDKIEAAAQSLLGILNDILDFSKVEADKLEIEWHPFRLDRVLRNLSSLLSSTLGEKNLDLLFDLSPDLPRALNGDALRLQQVLTNLMGNAVKFTQSGEVVLRIRVNGHEGDKVFLEFTVRDTGIGIDPEKLEIIFEGFSQAEASTTRRFGGTGLGLAISQRLVRLMGGELQVDSVPGKGSTFGFVLPLGLAEAGHEPEEGLVSPRRFRLLVVDDNPAARETLVTMAQMLGWSAEARATPGEARLLLEQDKGFDAVLVDRDLPERQGVELLSRIKAGFSGKTVPAAVMLLTHGTDRDMDGVVPDAYLVKPVTPSMLFDAVVEATGGEAAQLSGRRVRREGPQRLKELHLLLVEDNPMNQQVAERLLVSEGARVEIANDGASALARARQGLQDIHAILMDIQMPDMDGYTVTAELRKVPGGTSVPVIAMTANVMLSDREACLAAGMVDHVAKPINLDLLVETLLKHCRPLPDAPVRPVMTATPSGPRSLRELDLGAALARLGEDRELYASVARSFRAEQKELMSRLLLALSHGNPAEARRECHTLKGIAGTLGAVGLQALALEGELLFKGEPPPSGTQARELAQRLEQGIDETSDALEAVADRFDPPRKTEGTGRPGLSERQRTCLEALIPLLEAGNLKAVEVYKQFLQEGAACSEAPFTVLQEAMNRLDLRAASQACSQLLGDPSL